MIAIHVADHAVNTALHRLLHSTQNPAPALNEVGAGLKFNVQETFKRSADPYGTAWKSLSQTTILHRLLRNKKKNFLKSGKLSRKGINTLLAGFQPLRDTGALMNSITCQLVGNGLVVGTNIPYAKTHQFGADKGQYGNNIPWGDIPPRPFMPIRNSAVDLPDAWANEIIDTFRRHIMQGTPGVTA